MVFKGSMIKSDTQRGVRVLRQVMDRCGVDEARSFWTSVKIRQWLSAGLSESMILSVVDRVMTQARKTNRDFVPGSLSYFDRAMNAVLERCVA